MHIGNQYYKYLLKFKVYFGLIIKGVSKVNETTNPAIRLHNILSELFEYDPGTRIHKALSNEFGIIGLEECIEAYVKLIKLAKHCIRNIESLSDIHNKQLYLGSVTRILSKLEGYSYLSTTDSLEKNINESDMDFLHIISDLFNSKNINEKNIDEKIPDLGQELNNLIATILESNLDKDVIKDLVKVLNYLKMSLDCYQIDGVKGFKDALESFLGHFYINNDFYQSLKKENKDDGLFEKMISFTTKFNDLYTFATNTTPLISSVTSMLLA